MQKRAKRAKCGHFSGQFSRCCLWGQKRPRPVCRVMDAANAFPSNCRSVCRVNDSKLLIVSMGLRVWQLTYTEHSRWVVNKSSSLAGSFIRSHYSASDLRPLARQPVSDSNLPHLLSSEYPPHWGAPSSSSFPLMSATPPQTCSLWQSLGL